jgi:hypothetical protein
MRHHSVMDIHFANGPDDLVTWIASSPGVMQRASHALALADTTWLIDPVDHPDVRARLEALPPVAGVVQLLDRHGRDCAAMAAEFGAPLCVTPGASIAGTPFEVITVKSGRHWKESALWWPDRGCLVVAEVLGTASYFRAPGQRVGMHPFARIAPPRMLQGYPATHLLMGHGSPVHSPDAGALADAAIARARRSSPRWALSLVTGSVRRADRRAPDPLT